MAKGNHQWTLDNQSELPPPHKRWPLAIGLILVIGLSGVLISGMVEWGPPERTSGTESRRLEFYNKSQTAGTPDNTPHIKVWWDDIPADLRESAGQPDSVSSNIHPGDYAGPEACRKCHQKNYDGWSDHPHRWMNALADASTVVGDFSGTSISYLGGGGDFF